MDVFVLVRLNFHFGRQLDSIQTFKDVASKRPIRSLKYTEVHNKPLVMVKKNFPLNKIAKLKASSEEQKNQAQDSIFEDGVEWNHSDMSDIRVRFVPSPNHMFALPTPSSTPDHTKVNIS